MYQCCCQVLVVYMSKVAIEVSVWGGLLVFGVQNACRVLVVEVAIFVSDAVEDVDRDWV